MDQLTATQTREQVDYWLAHALLSLEQTAYEDLKRGSMKLQRQDLARLTRKLEAAQKDTAPVERAVAEVGEDLLGRSLDVTPKESGDLRRSGNSRPYDEPGGPGVSVGYDAEYALAVHEMLSDEVDWSTPGTGPKYLEGPFLQEKARYAKHIKDSVRKGLQG